MGGGWQGKKLHPQKFRKIEITGACVNDIPLGFRETTRFKINSAHEICRKGCGGTVEKDLATSSACLPCKVILCILRSRFRHSFVRLLLSLSFFTKWPNRGKRVERVDMDNLAFYIQSLEISEEFIRRWRYMEKKKKICACWNWNNEYFIESKWNDVVTIEHGESDFSWLI